MLRSMTGFGRAHGEAEGWAVRVEAKSVNGRFLKLTLKAPALLSPWEAEIERTLKNKVTRGSVTLSFDLQPTDPSSLVSVNEPLVRAYQAEFRRLGLSEERIPALPGVLSGEPKQLAPSHWRLVAEVLERALSEMVSMREREGEHLRQVLATMLANLRELHGAVAARAPAVVSEYHDKLTARIERLLEGQQVPLEPEHLAREVALFADRSDITEELHRLEAHFQRAAELLGEGGVVGRTLEFVAQEMHREVNTIGSKSADATVAHQVVAMKAEIEKLKEQVANVE